MSIPRSSKQESLPTVSSSESQNSLSPDPTIEVSPSVETAMSNTLPSGTDPAWAVPIAPDLNLLGAIHRHDDGVITFHEKLDGQFKNLFAIRSEHLPRNFPEIVSQLDADAFMSMNAFGIRRLAAIIYQQVSADSPADFGTCVPASRISISISPTSRMAR